MRTNAGLFKEEKAISTDRLLESQPKAFLPFLGVAGLFGVTAGLFYLGHKVSQLVGPARDIASSAKEIEHHLAEAVQIGKEIRDAIQKISNGIDQFVHDFHLLAKEATGLLRDIRDTVEDIREYLKKIIISPLLEALSDVKSAQQLIQGYSADLKTFVNNLSEVQGLNDKLVFSVNRLSMDHNLFGFLKSAPGMALWIQTFSMIEKTRYLQSLERKKADDRVVLHQIRDFRKQPFYTDYETFAKNEFLRLETYTKEQMAHEQYVDVSYEGHNVVYKINLGKNTLDPVDINPSSIGKGHLCEYYMFSWDTEKKQLRMHMSDVKGNFKLLREDSITKHASGNDGGCGRCASCTQIHTACKLFVDKIRPHMQPIASVLVPTVIFERHTREQRKEVLTLFTSDKANDLTEVFIPKSGSLALTAPATPLRAENAETSLEEGSFCINEQAANTYPAKL